MSALPEGFSFDIPLGDIFIAGCAQHDIVHGLALRANWQSLRRWFGARCLDTTIEGLFKQIDLRVETYNGHH